MKGQRYFAARQDEKKGAANQKGKIKPEYRDFLQKLFSNLKVKNFNTEDFPDDEIWRGVFYRTVDSLVDGGNGSRLRKVEEELGCWTGSVDQNKTVNMKMSSYVKTSFKAYEKTRKPIQESYFKF